MLNVISFIVLMLMQLERVLIVEHHFVVQIVQQQIKYMHFVQQLNLLMNLFDVKLIPHFHSLKQHSSTITELNEMLENEQDKNLMMKKKIVVVAEVVVDNDQHLLIAAVVVVVVFLFVAVVLVVVVEHFVYKFLFLVNHLMKV